MGTIAKLVLNLIFVLYNEKLYNLIHGHSTEDIQHYFEAILSFLHCETAVNNSCKGETSNFTHGPVVLI